MEMMQKLAARAVAPSEVYTYVHFEADRIDTPRSAPRILVPGEHYIRLWLVGMSLRNDREWFTQRQPAVYSRLQFQFGDKTETVTHIAGPSTLGEAEFSQAPRQVLLNYPLTTLLPFNGGAIELEAGLLAVPGSNDLLALLGTLGDFSKLLVVPELSTALNVSSALASGFGRLVGFTEKKPVLRLHQGFAAGEGGGNGLRSGYFAITDMPANQGDAARLYVVKDRLCAGDSIATAKPLGGHDYMLFRLEAREERDDWEALSSVRIPYEAALEALGRSNFARNPDMQRSLVENAEQSLKEAQFAALHARELTRKIGRNQVIDAMQRGFEEARATLGQGAVPDAQPSFQTAMDNRLPPTEAKALGDFPEQELAAARGVPYFGYLKDLELERRYDTAARAIHLNFDIPAIKGPTIVERTPHMDVQAKSPLRPGDEFKVRVFADRKAARPGEKSIKLVIAVPQGQQAVNATVWVADTPHFEVIGAHEQPFVIDVNEPDKETSAMFEIRVRKDAPAGIPPRLAAYFNHEGRPSGQVSVEVGITFDEGSDKPPQSAAIDGGEAPPQDRIHLETDADVADLIIEVQDPLQNRQTLKIWARTTTQGSIGPLDWLLPAETGALVAGFMEEFVDPDSTPDQRLLSLRGAGTSLWETLPMALRDFVWQVFDRGKLQTILVVSAEPNIPWELMIPTRPKGSPAVREKPLGVEFSLGRWHPEDNVSPEQKIRVRNSCVVAPEYKTQPPQKLAHALAEAKMVAAHFNGKTIRPALVAAVLDALRAPGNDLYHFVCHGSTQAANGTQTVYVDGGRKLTALQVRGLRGTANGFGEGPMVFLNACEVGKPVPALVGSGGFAKSFIELGARAVVAPLWSVRDSIAQKIARDFYDQVANSGKTFAEALKNIRGNAYDPAQGNEDSYAAYCLYGDPCARMIVEPVAI